MRYLFFIAIAAIVIAVAGIAAATAAAAGGIGMTHRSTAYGVHNEDNFLSATSNATHVFFGTSPSGSQGEPARVVAFSMTTGRRTGAFMLGDGEDRAMAMVADSTYIYVLVETALAFGPGGSRIPARIAKILHAPDADRPHRTFKKIGKTLELSPGENNGRAMILDATSGLLYVSLFGTDRVAKIATPSSKNKKLRRVTSLHLNQREDGEGEPFALVADDHHVFVGTCANGIIVQLDKGGSGSDMTRVGSLKLKGNEQHLYAAAIDSATTKKQFAYFVALEAPAVVVKVQLSPELERIDALSLDAAQHENYVRTALIYSDNLFLSCDAWPNGRIVQISLRDFTKTGQLKLPAGDEKLVSGVLPAGSRVAWFGTFSSPGRAIAVDLGGGGGGGGVDDKKSADL